MSLGSGFTKSSTAPSITLARTVEGASGGGLNSAVSAAPRFAAMGGAMLTHDQIYERLYAVWLDLEGSDAKTKLGGLIADLEAESLESERPLAELGGIDLVYNPDDQRHWLNVGLLLERGNEDINDCRVTITRKP